MRCLRGRVLRIGEALGLELRHVAGRTLTVEQSCWQGSLQAPKTFNALRKVDLSHDLADALQRFIGRRKIGLVFANRDGNPLSQTNLLSRSLHPLRVRLRQNRLPRSAAIPGNMASQTACTGRPDSLLARPCQPNSHRWLQQAVGG
jgi:integrase